MTVLLRVIPDGRAPVYLGKTEALPEVPVTKADGELTGNFLVGEGSYSLDALVHDDAKRVCTSKWRIQAKPSGGERELKPSAPPSSVREISSQQAMGAPAQGGSRIERLTILLHAAPARPQAAKVEQATATMFEHSLASILNQLPAWSVRLVVFNLNQQAVLFQKDDFTAADLPRVAEAMEQMELARVDVRTLQNRHKVDVLSDLIDKETRQAKPATAVILMAPRSAAHLDPSFQPDPQQMAVSRWFYLPYHPATSLMPQRFGGRGMASGDDGTGDMSPHGRQGPIPMAGPPLGAQPADAVEQFYKRIKGETLSVGTPHEFAEALRRISAELPAVKAAPAPVVSAPLSAEPKPPAVEPTEPPAGGELGVQENPVEVLMRLRDRVLEHARKVPNHICVETVERQRFEPVVGRLHKSCEALLDARSRSAPSLRRDSTDWLRLDVGLADNHEIFSWAGAAHFEERDLDEIVPEGAIGTGLFATLLLSVFENRNPHYQFAGEETVDGRRLFTYSFKVPQAESHYRVKTRQKDWIVTGYEGELLVNPRTAELVRINVRTDQLPDSTSSCEIDTVMEYGIVPLDGFDYLLPQSTRQRFIGREGDEAENRTGFASCREYRGESTLTFGGSADAKGGAARNRLGVALPAGQAAVIELTKAIAFQGSAAGDPIEGRLAGPLRDTQRDVTLAPQGAKVVGRLMRVETRATGQYSIALRWETVELDGMKVPLSLKPNRAIPDLRRSPQGTLQRRGVEIELPRAGEEHYAVYHLTGKDSRLEAGLRTEWVTIEP
ncbi:MAG TPA: hypothetical protein VKB88_27810 [Bryobacteraceae bacterium]|nr:hypothetical protein [Bryobacteraceae bacterium]